MLFAVSDSVWLALIGLVSLLIKEWSDRSRSAANASATQKVVVDVAAKQDSKLAVVSNQVQEIHEATNGLTSALGEAKLAQGTAEGTAVGLQQGRDETRPTAREAFGLAKEELVVKSPAGVPIATIEPKAVIRP